MCHVLVPPGRVLTCVVGGEAGAVTLGEPAPCLLQPGHVREAGDEVSQRWALCRYVDMQ